jgi:hypothetical protein
MTAVEKLISALEKYGTCTQGEMSISKSGIPYRYDTCIAKSHRFLIAMFELAKKEVYGTREVKKLMEQGTDHRTIHYGEYSFGCDYPTNKGQAPTKVTYHRLVKSPA